MPDFCVMSVLLLNASYEPLTVVSWKRAITLLFSERAEMVEQDGDRVIRSAGGLEVPMPRVVRLVRMVSFASMRARRRPVFSKSALHARDGGRCQVADCGRDGDTIDHVIARSRGGQTTWENCVLMCAAHNAAKGDQSLEELGWSLRCRPAAPAAALVVAGVAARPEWAAWLQPA